MIAELATAASLGLLTAVSPCPLATNVAAVSFLGRHAQSPRRSLTLPPASSTIRQPAATSHSQVARRASMAS